MLRWCPWAALVSSQSTWTTAGFEFASFRSIGCFRPPIWYDMRSWITSRPSWTRASAPDEFRLGSNSVSCRSPCACIACKPAGVQTEHVTCQPSHSRAPRCDPPFTTGTKEATKGEMSSRTARSIKSITECKIPRPGSVVGTEVGHCHLPA